LVATGAVLFHGRNCWWGWPSSRRQLSRTDQVLWASPRRCKDWRRTELVRR